MTRDILDYQGTKIGVMNIDPTWTEDFILRKLAEYAKPPLSPSEKMSVMLSRKVAESRDLSEQAINEFQEMVFKFFFLNNIPNEVAILKSCWAQHRLRAVDVNFGTGPMIIDVMNLAVSGSIETAWVVLGQMTPDNMKEPHHFFTQEWIDQFRSILGSKVGLS